MRPCAASASAACNISIPKPLIHGYDGRSFSIILGAGPGLARGRARRGARADLRSARGTALLASRRARPSPARAGLQRLPRLSRPAGKIRSVALDPASLTSVHLLKVLLRGISRPAVRRLVARAAPAKRTARLLIGNQAIEFRRHAPAGFQSSIWARNGSAAPGCLSSMPCGCCGPISRARKKSPRLFVN